jgi:hypothetical protein
MRDAVSASSSAGVRWSMATSRMSATSWGHGFGQLHVLVMAITEPRWSVSQRTAHQAAFSVRVRQDQITSQRSFCKALPELSACPRASAPSVGVESSPPASTAHAARRRRSRDRAPFPARRRRRRRRPRRGGRPTVPLPARPSAGCRPVPPDAPSSLVIRLSSAEGRTDSSTSARRKRRFFVTPSSVRPCGH